MGGWICATEELKMTWRYQWEIMVSNRPRPFSYYTLNVETSTAPIAIVTSTGQSINRLFIRKESDFLNLETGTRQRLV